MVDCSPSYVCYPCLNWTEGLNLLPTMYQNVKNHCFLDSNEHVTYWIGHSPDYPKNILTMQKSWWVHDDELDIFDSNYSSLSCIPITLAQMNQSACPSLINKYRRYVLNKRPHTPTVMQSEWPQSGPKYTHMILEGTAVNLPLYPSAPDPHNILSDFLPKAKDQLESNKVVKAFARSCLYSNIFVLNGAGQS